jgi:hypothetical protein
MDVASAPILDPARIVRSVRTRRRWLAVVIAVGTGSLLLVAAWLVPSTNGHGTHTQLGLPQCGWVVGMGIPCPSCGMTTSFAHAANGNLLGSFRAQPAGAVLAMGTAMVFVLSVWVLATGSAIGAFWFDRIDRKFFILGGILILGAWVYKILVFKGVL